LYREEKKLQNRNYNYKDIFVLQHKHRRAKAISKLDFEEPNITKERT
jgi:hypothetical protein